MSLKTDCLHLTSDICNLYNVALHSCTGCNNYKSKLPTIYVNIFGAPGAGKSTLAAKLFAQLKLQGASVLLVTEFAKDMYWESALHMFRDPVEQLYMTANQIHRLNRLNGKVQYVITDSPILMAAAYAGDLGLLFVNLVHRVSSSYTRINVLLQRSTTYVPLGRVQSLALADDIATQIKAILDRYLHTYFYPAVNSRVDLMLPFIITKQCLRLQYLCKAITIGDTL